MIWIVRVWYGRPFSLLQLGGTGGRNPPLGRIMNIIMITRFVLTHWFFELLQWSVRNWYHCLSIYRDQKVGQIFKTIRSTIPFQCATCRYATRFQLDFHVQCVMACPGCILHGTAKLHRGHVKQLSSMHACTVFWKSSDFWLFAVLYRWSSYLFWPTALEV